MSSLDEAALALSKSFMVDGISLHSQKSIDGKIIILPFSPASLSKHGKLQEVSLCTFFFIVRVSHSTRVGTQSPEDDDYEQVHASFKSSRCQLRLWKSNSLHEKRVIISHSAIRVSISFVDSKLIIAD